MCNIKSGDIIKIRDEKTRYEVTKMEIVEYVYFDLPWIEAKDINDENHRIKRCYDSRDIIIVG